MFLKLREEICNLEFLQILTHFSGLFAAPRADFLLALVYNKATVACYSLCFFVYKSLQMSMNACLKMLVEPIIPVTIPLDHTDVNVQLDMLLAAFRSIQVCCP